MTIQCLIEDNQVVSAEELVEAIKTYNATMHHYLHIAEDEIEIVSESIERGQNLHTALRQLVAVLLTSPMRDYDYTQEIEEIMRKAMKFI